MRFKLLIILNAFYFILPSQSIESKLKWMEAHFNENPDSVIQLSKLLLKQDLNDSDKAACFYQSARAYLILGDINQSSQFINNSIHIYNSFPNSILLADALNIKSIVHSRLNEREKSNKYLYQALKIYESHHHMEGMNKVYTNLAGAYIETNQKDSTIKYINASILTAISAKDSLMLFFSKFNAAYFYEKEKDFEKILKDESFLIGYTQKNNRHDNLASAYTLFGSVYSQLNQPQVAEKYFNACKQLCRKQNLDVEYMDNLEAMISHYESRNPTKALKITKRFYAIKDSLYSLEKVKQIQSLENTIALNEERKLAIEKDLKIQSQENEIYQNRFYLIIALAILFLIVIALYFVNRQLKLRKSKNKIISKQNEELATKNKEITDSIFYAERIQKALLHSKKEVEKYFIHSYVLFKPKDIVSGDFFFCDLREGIKFIVLSDCTGHGVPGGFMSFLGMTYLKEIFNKPEIFLPNQILESMHTRLISDLDHASSNVNDGMDASVLAINEKQEKYTFSGAMHGLLHYRKSINNLEHIKGSRSSIGARERMFEFENIEGKFEKGDLFVLFSDGIVDQFGGPKEKKFKLKQLKDIITNHRVPAKELGKIIQLKLEQWQGELEQIDDISLIIIEL